MELIIGAVFGAAVKFHCRKKYWSSLALNLEVYVDIFFNWNCVDNWWQ